MKRKCKICKADYTLGEHYCKNCGTNLSNKIEKTDAIRFFQLLFAGFGVFYGFFALIFFKISLEGCWCDGTIIESGLQVEDLFVFTMPVCFITISVFLRKIYKDLCLKNINKE